MGRLKLRLARVAVLYKLDIRDFRCLSKQMIFPRGAERNSSSQIPGKLCSFQMRCAVLACLLAIFLILVFLMPLSTAIQIGGDEGFELAKALLCKHGFNLYTDIWNDQPPLHTFLITKCLQHLSPSILGPRLIAVGFSLALLSAVFLLSCKVSNLRVAAITTVLLIVSPGFLTLSASCMLEIPALATAIWAILVICTSNKGPGKSIFCGALIGISLQFKLISLVLFPILAFVYWQRHRSERSSWKKTSTSMLLTGLCALGVFIGIDLMIDGGAFLRNFNQSWASHFAGTKSYEYGSPEDYSFDWGLLLKHWDVVLPAICGIGAIAANKKINSSTVFPLAWAAWSLVVFTIHKPWWPYYYVHTAIPLCWCAAIGLDFLWSKLRAQRRRISFVLFAIFFALAIPWAGRRIYRQIRDVRDSPQTYNTLVLREIERVKPYAQWMFADQQIYSFHSGIPIPPSLGVIMLKRMWSGEMTNERISIEMEQFKPGVILLMNDQRPVPFASLLMTNYRLVYHDSEHRLFVRRDIINAAEL